VSGNNGNLLLAKDSTENIIMDEIKLEALREILEWHNQCAFLTEEQVAYVKRLITTKVLFG